MGVGFRAKNIPAHPGDIAPKALAEHKRWILSRTSYAQVRMCRTATISWFPTSGGSDFSTEI